MFLCFIFSLTVGRQRLWAQSKRKELKKKKRSKKKEKSFLLEYHNTETTKDSLIEEMQVEVGWQKNKKNQKKKKKNGKNKMDEKFYGQYTPIKGSLTSK